MRKKKTNQDKILGKQDRGGNQNRQKLELKYELKMETIVRQVISLNITK